jgi:hypothetical protein
MRRGIVPFIARDVTPELEGQMAIYIGRWKFKAAVGGATVA